MLRRGSRALVIVAEQRTSGTKAAPDRHPEPHAREATALEFTTEPRPSGA